MARTGKKCLKFWTQKNNKKSPGSDCAMGHVSQVINLGRRVRVCPVISPLGKSLLKNHSSMICKDFTIINMYEPSQYYPLWTMMNQKWLTMIYQPFTMDFFSWGADHWSPETRTCRGEQFPWSADAWPKNPTGTSGNDVKYEIYIYYLYMWR